MGEQEADDQRKILRLKKKLISCHYKELNQSVFSTYLCDKLDFS